MKIKNNKNYKEKKIKKVIVGVGGGGFLVQVNNLIKECPPDIEIILFAPIEVRNKLEDVLKNRVHNFIDVPKLLRQRRNSNLFNNIFCFIVGVTFAVYIVKKYKPILIASVGQRVSVYLMVAARFTGVRAYFIECVTRVKQASTTGRFIDTFNLADKIFVQWPQSVPLYKNAKFKGRLV